MTLCVEASHPQGEPRALTLQLHEQPGLGFRATFLGEGEREDGWYDASYDEPPHL